MSDQKQQAVSEGIVGQSASTGGLEPAGEELIEGMYQKMWKDFVSLQRGDVRLLCKDAERYRYFSESVALKEACTRYWNKDRLDREIDEDMRSNVK